MSLVGLRECASTHKTALPNATDWRARKPRLRSQPAAWLRRKFRLWLNDLLGPVGLKVTERVGFGPLKEFVEARHIIDVGVCKGTPGLYEAFPGAYLELFEPASAFHPTIEASVLNARQGRLHRFALGREEGRMPLIRPGRGSGAIVTPSSFTDRRETEHVMVPVRRLDCVLRREDIRRPAVLKIDTEGFENEVLHGAQGVLSCIDLIVVEVQLHRNSAYRPNDVIAFLRQHSFEMVGALDHEVIERSVHCTDLVFQRC